MEPEDRTKRGLLSIAIVAGIAWISACTYSPSSVQIADVIYAGGDIITMNDAQPIVEAIAIRDGKIVAVGTKANIDKYVGGSTKTVNLDGKTLLPGFIDAHGHVFNAGLQSLVASPDGTVNNIATLQ